MHSEGVIFAEDYAAAQSLKNSWTRLASTYKCIRVVLTKDELIIRPRWNVGWLIFLLALDLYHTVPISRIMSVEEKGMWHNYGKVEVTFAPERDTQRKVLLYLKNYQEFMARLRQLIGHTS